MKTNLLHEIRQIELLKNAHVYELHEEGYEQQTTDIKTR
jgi:hypothetical protein